MTNNTPSLPESDVQNKIRLAASKAGLRLWRNNNGAVTTEDGRHIRFGLANESSALNASVKSSDLIGITPVVITADMIGKTVGVFTAIEVKKQNWKFTGTERELAQLKFIDIVIDLGGIGKFSTGDI